MITWEYLCNDKRFQDLPFKIELNRRGQIIMSPTYVYHGSHANRIARLLEKHLPKGEVVVECAVETGDGVKEADVAWLSPALAKKNANALTCIPAPEICAEVMSPSNSMEEMMGKRQSYIAAGAREYWLCDREGNVRFFDGTKELPRSQMCPKFPKKLPVKKH